MTNIFEQLITMRLDEILTVSTVVIIVLHLGIRVAQRC